MHRKFLLGGVAAAAMTVAICGPVSAADMPAKAPVYKAAGGLYNWTGSYIGGHIGYGSAKFWFNSGEEHRRDRSPVGGLQLGHNWQSGNIVYGYEADISAAGFWGGESNYAEAKVDLLASIRGRLGLSFNRVLWYATAGGAYVHGKAESSSSGSRKSFGKFVPVLGVGVDWAHVNNLTFRLEVLNYFDTSKFNAGDDRGKVKNILVGRFGVNYRY